MNGSSVSNIERRVFLLGGAAMAAASFVGLNPSTASAEPPPETPKLRLAHAPSICIAPQYLAEELLRLEGFTHVSYVPLGTRLGPYALAEGRADMTMWDVPALMPLLDARKPIVVLAGVHAGCYELFGNERVGAVRELKGKTVAVQYFGGGDHVMLSSMLAYVGVRPDEVK